MPFDARSLFVLACCVALAFFVSLRFAKPPGKPLGAFGWMFSMTVVFAVSALFSGLLLMFLTLSHDFLTHPKYDATVVDIRSEWVEQSYQDRNGDSRTRDVEMHRAVLRFEDADGRVVERPNTVSSARKPVIGDTITVAYRDGELQEFSARTGLMLFALACMVILLGFVVVGFGLYAANLSAVWVTRMGMGFLTHVIIPVAIVGFMGGLIYGVYDHHADDRDLPVWAQAAALSFAAILFFVLIGYMRMLIRNR